MRGNTARGQGCGRTETLIKFWWWENKWVQPVWKSVGQYLLMWDVHIPITQQFQSEFMSILSLSSEVTNIYTRGFGKDKSVFPRSRIHAQGSLANIPVLCTRLFLREHVRDIWGYRSGESEKHQSRKR